MFGLENLFEVMFYEGMLVLYAGVCGMYATTSCN